MTDSQNKDSLLQFQFLQVANAYLLISYTTKFFCAAKILLLEPK